MCSLSSCFPCFSSSTPSAEATHTSSAVASTAAPTKATTGTKAIQGIATASSTSLQAPDVDAKKATKVSKAALHQRMRNGEPYLRPYPSKSKSRVVVVSKQTSHSAAVVRSLSDQEESNM